MRFFLWVLNGVKTTAWRLLPSTSETMSTFLVFLTRPSVTSGCQTAELHTVFLVNGAPGSATCGLVSLTQQLFLISWVPGAMSGVEDTKANKTRHGLCPRSLHSSEENTTTVTLLLWRACDEAHRGGQGRFPGGKQAWTERWRVRWRSHLSKGGGTVDQACKDSGEEEFREQKGLWLMWRDWGGMWLKMSILRNVFLCLERHGKLMPVLKHADDTPRARFRYL